MEPLFCVLTGLVLADENGVWHWEEPHQSAVLQVVQYFMLTLYLTVHVSVPGGGGGGGGGDVHVYTCNYAAIFTNAVHVAYLKTLLFVA